MAREHGAAQDRRAAGARRRRDRGSGRGNGRWSPGTLARGDVEIKAARGAGPRRRRLAAGPIAIRPKRSCAFRVAARYKRPFAAALAWTSESPTAAQLGQEMLAAIYRVAYQQRHGLPTSLRAMLDQEGLAGVFAGALHPALRWCRPGERTRAIIAVPGSDEPPYPVDFPGAVRRRGRRAAGLRAAGVSPARAGFEVALADALERRRRSVDRRASL